MVATMARLAAREEKEEDVFERPAYATSSFHTTYVAVDVDNSPVDVGFVAVGALDLLVRADVLK